jgi:hypothetical protein
MNFTKIEIIYYWDVENRKQGGERGAAKGHYQPNYIQLDGPSSSAKQNVFVYG